MSAKPIELTEESARRTAAVLRRQAHTDLLHAERLDHEGEGVYESQPDEVIVGALLAQATFVEDANYGRVARVMREAARRLS